MPGQKACCVGSRVLAAKRLVVRVPGSSLRKGWVLRRASCRLWRETPPRRLRWAQRGGAGSGQNLKRPRAERKLEHDHPSRPHCAVCRSTRRRHRAPCRLVWAPPRGTKHALLRTALLPARFGGLGRWPKRPTGCSCVPRLAHMPLMPLQGSRPCSAPELASVLGDAGQRKFFFLGLLFLKNTPLLRPSTPRSQCSSPKSRQQTTEGGGWGERGGVPRAQHREGHSTPRGPHRRWQCARGGGTGDSLREHGRLRKKARQTSG